MNKDLIIDVSSSIIDEPKKKYTTTYAVPNRNRLFQILSNAGDKLDGLGDRVVDFGRNAKSRLADALLGKEIEEQQTIINPDGTMETGINNGGRTGGLINKVANFVADVPKGAYENMTETFTPQNWAPDKTKGLGYRLGEALGTGARLLDNSFVRGALAYGLSKYNGDFNPLEQGLTATLTNMQNKTNDKIYRDDLARNGVDTSNIRGFIDNNTYGNLIRSQQLRDNEKYRNEILKSNLAQQEALNQYRKNQLAYDWATLQERKEERKENAEKPNKNLGNLEAVTNQLMRFEETFKTMPGKIESNTFGRLRNATGFQTPQEANFNSQRTLLFNKIARDLGGEKGVLSDQDIKRVEASLPNYTDSYEQKQAKMQAIYDLLEDRLNVEGARLNKETSQSQTDTLNIL